MPSSHLVIRPSVAIVLAILSASGAEPAAPLPAVSSAAPSAATQESGRLTIDDLVRLARQHHPLAQVVASEARASAAALLAARAWANPEVELEAGRARGRGDVAEDDVLVGRVGINQPLGWPGTRSRRVAAAVATGSAGEAGAALALLDLEADVRATALDLRIERQARILAEAALASARDVLATVTRRATAGEAGRGNVLRVEIEVARLEQEAVDHQRQAEAALAKLHAWCGRDLSTVTLDDERDVQAPTGSLPHPRLAHLDQVVRQRQAELALSRSIAAPDVSVGVYGERDVDVDGVGVSLALSVPLWDRNQGGIALARAAVARAEAERALARTEIEVAAVAAEHAATDAAQRAERFRAQILPKAREALRLSLATYAGNESSMLDLLDALRTAHGIESEALAAERDAGHAVLAWRQALGTTTDLRGDAP